MQKQKTAMIPVLQKGSHSLKGSFTPKDGSSPMIILSPQAHKEDSPDKIL